MNRHKKVVALTGVFLMTLSIVSCGQVKEEGIVSTEELSTIQQDNSIQTSDEYANSEIKENETASDSEGESVTNQQEMESINPESFPVGEYQDDMGSQLIISKGDGNQYMVTFGIYKLAYMENAEGNYDVDSGILSFSGTEDMGNTLSADVRVKGENLIVTLTHSEYGENTCPPGTELEFRPYQL